MKTLRHPAFIMFSRTLNLAFCFLTTVYCVLNYNAFTYEQFIKPNVSAALASFAVWHGAVNWLVLSVTALTLAPFLETSRTREVGWTYLAACLVLSAWLFTHPLWLVPGMSRANLALALVCCVPPVWLAVFDHVAAPPMPMLMPISPRRSWTTCWIAAIVAFAVYAVVAPIRLRVAGGIPLSRDGLLLGWIISALGHLTLFTVVYLLLATVAALASRSRSPGMAQYWAVSAGAVMAVTTVLLRIVLAPIAIRGAAAWATSLAAGIAVAAAWSGIARHRMRGLSAPRVTPSALDAWFAPVAWPARRSLWRVAIKIALLALGAQIVIARLSTFDWEFMLQKLATLVFWSFVAALVHSVVEERPARQRLAAPAVVILLFAVQQVALARGGTLVGATSFNPSFALDGYAAVDPSFRVARDTLGSAPGAEAADFYAYLRANSTIDDDTVEPVDINFVRRWTAGESRPPDVFLFIVDSLRRDYVSPYNAAVDFTPAIDRFAADSLVFRRAFSRYAGTGLAVPSIWAGSMLVHKQYVTPFAPMNALEKLVRAKGYRRLMTEDHLTDQLFTRSPETIGLDHNVPEMLHTFCRTMDELVGRLDGMASRHDRPPIFAMTRPLELHIGNIASAKVPAGESYPGFYGPYAARVRRIDGCFGQFVEALKRMDRYDNSVIVLTADHGDSLGEGQRWGHGFTAFPEVLRVPLIVHVPSRLRDRFAADLGRVSFSTDITPTLYSLLGEPPAMHGHRGTRERLLGSSLLVDPSADLSWRRRESYLVASSYGPVYGVIDRNGRRLYVADGVESREYAYDLRPDGADVRVGITDAERERYRAAIREQIADIAAWYGLTKNR